MTNKEKYKQAFSVLHTSDNFILEVEKMASINRKHQMRTLVASLIVCLIIMTGGGTAYAMDIGGIQYKVQMWIYGEQTDVDVDFKSDGTYSYSYEDQSGKVSERSGGGIALEKDGTERPLTNEELMEELSEPSAEVEYEEDGSVWIYYCDQKIDITDKFKDGICYARLEGEDGPLYMTIKYKKGFSVSPHKYDDPSTFE